MFYLNKANSMRIAVLNLLREIDAGYKPNEEKLQLLNNIRTLDISEESINDLPNSIILMSNLERLNISNNSLLVLPNSIWHLSNLIELDVSNNFLSFLPEEICHLKKLKKIDLSYNNLETLPEGICKLTNLSTFYAIGNELISLPESISELKNLTKINISSNQIKSLPENISKLKLLNKLDVTCNELASLPENIGELSELTELLVADNNLTELPPSAKNLNNLLTLNLSKNQFTLFPKWLSELNKLDALYLSGNLIKKFPDCMNKMKQLTLLNISEMQLKKAPDFVQELSNLTNLNISANSIKKLPDWLGKMQNLKILSICELDLAEIPRSLLNLNLPFFTNDLFYLGDYRSGIYMENTKLSLQPISLFDQSRDRSDDYMMSRSLIENYFNTKKIPIREAKVIFLGDGKVGKTYTIQRLLNNCIKGDYPTKETHGILIENITETKDNMDYKIRVWDFGGQDIMHEMHRCFLTDRTCYVVMVDTRINKQTGRAKYWLRTVQSVAPKAPVLLLINEIGGSKNLDLDYTSLKNEFPNLVGVSLCSSLNATDEEFRQKVREPIIQQALNLDSCKMKLPESWEEVRQNLLKQKSNLTYYISKTKFHELCDQYNVPNDNSLRAWLLTWFNDLGVCFSYHLGENGREQTHDYQILDPMWLTSAVYKIIWEKEKNEDGIITLKEIQCILKEPGSAAMKKDGIPCLENVSYNDTECQYVLDIMHKFCISYPADDTREFMPTLCKSDSRMEPKPQIWNQHISYKYKYTFLPESVIHRLMIYCYSNLRPGRRWRKGFWLESPAQGLSALIRTIGENEEENIIQIDVYSQKQQFGVWLWLQPLCEQIAEINNALSLKPISYVLAENNEEEKWFPINTVWNWRLKGEKNLQEDESYFDIQSLLLRIYGNFYPEIEEKLKNYKNILVSPLINDFLSQICSSERTNRKIVDLSKPFPSDTKYKSDIVDALNSNKKAIEENTRAINNNTYIIQNNTKAIEECDKLLVAVRDDIIELPTELTEALVKQLSESNDQNAKKIATEMKLYSEPEKKVCFRKLLSDSANFATIVQGLAALYTNHGQRIVELFNKVFN